MEALGGTLAIDIIEGKLVRNTEVLGRMDCFIEIKYKDQVKRTAVHKNSGMNPKWNEKIEL